MFVYKDTNIIKLETRTKVVGPAASDEIAEGALNRFDHRGGALDSSTMTCRIFGLTSLPTPPVNHRNATII